MTTRTARTLAGIAFLALEGLGVSRIAIELYRPLPGGAEVGGASRRMGVKVERLTVYDGE